MLRATSGVEKLIGSEALADLKARIQKNCPEANFSGDLLDFNYSGLPDCVLNELTNTPEFGNLPKVSFHHSSVDFEIDYNVAVSGELGIAVTCAESKTASVHGLTLTSPIMNPLNKFKQDVDHLCGEELLPDDFNHLYFVSPSKMFTEVGGKTITLEHSTS
ncbi:hypothetical protein FOZ60_001965 [Perkinsus olseni]|uniref:Uncharacterized protein n=1 Tax=Perkinsus olseni TaxID=32597 RepID=A0A7J6P1N1_PEROL|nr:hypothetical protein FOZ60_001965 [Perkinsus olseni]